MAITVPTSAIEGYSGMAGQPAPRIPATTPQLYPNYPVRAPTGAPATPTPAATTPPDTTQAIPNPDTTNFDPSQYITDPDYWKHIAALNYTYQNTVGPNGTLTRATAQDQAARDLATNQTYAAARVQQRGLLNQANSQGLLESGQYGQRQGLATAGYLSRQGAIDAGLDKQLQALRDQAIAAGDTYNISAYNELLAAIDRQNQRNVNIGPDVPPPGPISPTTTLGASAQLPIFGNLGGTPGQPYPWNFTVKQPPPSKSKRQTAAAAATKKLAANVRGGRYTGAPPTAFQ